MKSQSMVLILFMSAVTACGGSGGGSTEPTTPQPTTPIEGGSPDEGDTEDGAGSNSLNTKSVRAAYPNFFGLRPWKTTIEILQRIPC